MSENDPAWQFFAALQREADPQSIDRSLARDEALDVVLNEIVSSLTTDQNLIRKRFYSLRRNRLYKDTHRRMLYNRRFRATHRRGGTDFGSVLLTAPTPTIFDQLAYSHLTDLIRTVLPEKELRLLEEMADGHSYADMASDRNMTVSGLKAKAFRVRQKVRASQISSALRCGLRRYPTAVMDA